MPKKSLVRAKFDDYDEDVQLQRGWAHSSRKPQDMTKAETKPVGSGNSQMSSPRGSVNQ